MNSTVFSATFFASVDPLYSNTGAVSGYTIGTTNFRSIESLKAGLEKAFAKDLGAYHILEVSVQNSNGGQILFSKDNYIEILEALEASLNETRITLDELLAD